MKPRLPQLLCLLAAFCTGAVTLSAQTVLYSGVSNNRFFTGNSWVGGIAPGASDTAQFGNHGNNATVMVNNGSIGSIEFLSTRTAAYLLSYDDGVSTLNLNGNVTVQTGAHAVGFSSFLNIALSAGDHVFHVEGIQPLTIAGVISGTGHFTKTGSGTLTLTGANTFNYTGGFGFVNSTAIHAGTVYVDGGAINHGTSGDLFVGENNGDNGSLWVLNGGDISGYFGVLGQSFGSTGSATLTGIGTTWTTSSGMGVGYNGNGTLSVLSGATVSTPAHANNSDSYIGYGTSSSGAATVSGTGSSWSTAVGLDIGYNGTGNLTISSGGAVSNTRGRLGVSAGGSGTVSVNNGTWTNSAELLVGNSGTGTLAISNGGDVTNTYSYIATQSGSNGAVTVDGAGSTWVNSGLLAVGQGGTGSLTISNGGAVSNTQGYAGYGTGTNGTVTVTGTGSTWTNSSNLAIGQSGTGSLSILAGGAVSNVTGRVGDGAGSTGTATVDGAGSTWTNSAQLFVGTSGNGTLLVQTGGVVTAANGSFGLNSGASGQVTVTGSGSTLTNTTSLFVGGAGAASLTAANGGTVNVNLGNGTLTLASMAGGTGTLNIGATSINSAAPGGIVNTATITTGSGTGTLQFNTTATSGTPYYLTKDGTSGGTAVVVAGGTSVVNTAGYNVLGGTNAYTGGTTVNGGTLQISGASSLPAGGNLVINTTSAGQTGSLSIGSGLTVSVGSLTYGGAGAGSNANNVITFPGTTLVLGGNVVYDATNNPSFARLGTGSTNVVELGVTRTFTIADSSNSNAEFLVGSTLTGSGAGVIKEGAGTLHMSFNTSTYTGATVVNAGIFSVNGMADGGAASSIGAASSAAANLVINNASFRYAGDAASTDRLFTLGGTAVTLDGSGSGALQFTNPGTLAFGSPNTNSTLTLTGSTLYNALRPILTDNGSGVVSLTKTGSGLWFINGANTYTGPTTIINGTLATGSPDFGNGYFTNGGLPSGLGASSSAAANLVISGGTLVIEGPAASSDRLFTIGTGGATLSDIGPAFTTGPITFSNTGAIALTGTNTARSLTLDGTSGQLFTLNPSLGDNGTGATSVVKNGTGLWQLNGANTYTGGTTINAGTLIMGGNSALGTGALTLNGGALSVASGVTFGNALNIGLSGGRIGGSGSFSSPLTLGAGVKIAPGSSPGTVNFAGGLTLNDGGTLEIEIRAPTGTPGTDWDFVNVTGTLNLSGLTTGGYTLKAISLDLLDTPGQPVSGLVGPASWTIATASTGITGFEAADFVFDTSQFYGGGVFSLSQSGNNLLLNFTPVPEPSTYALMLGGLALAGLQWRRRRAVARDR